MKPLPPVHYSTGGNKLYRQFERFVSINDTEEKEIFEVSCTIKAST